MTVASGLEQNLDQLEQHTWEECEGEPSIIKECKRLRLIALKDYRPADLSTMISQSLGLPHLVPLALEVLSRDPLVKGRDFPGDLLENVMAIGRLYWEQNKEQSEQIKDIVISINQDSLKDNRMKKLIQDFI